MANTTKTNDILVTRKSEESIAEAALVLESWNGIIETEQWAYCWSDPK